MYGLRPISFSRAKVLKYIKEPYNCKFITLTYREAQNQKVAYTRDLRKILDFVKNMGEFQLVSEISDNGKFHWHILIKVKDAIKTKIFLNYWQKKYGFSDIKDVDNYIGMFIYLRKQSNDWRDDIYQKIITNRTVGYNLKELKDVLNEKKRASERAVNEYNKLRGSIDKYYTL